MRSKKVYVKCDWCGRRFFAHHKISRSKHHFCSRKCKGRWWSKNVRGENSPRWKGVKVEKKCDYCGRVYKVKIKDLKGRKNHFCSHECYWKWLSNKEGSNHPLWNRVDVKCSCCGKKLARHPYRLRNHGNNHFCSYKCYWKWATGENSPFWKGGHEPYYGPNWSSQRRKARARDGYACQICGEKENGRELPVHHIIPFREFELERYKEANQLSNLIILCRPCHGKADRGKISIDVLKGMIA